jgi:hypothetical protein
MEVAQALDHDGLFAAHKIETLYRNGENNCYRSIGYARADDQRQLR